MNHNGTVPIEPIQDSIAGDPYAELALHIIRRAAWDYRQHPGYRRSVGKFFASEWYELLLDYISLCVPDFEFDEYILPSGVVIK